ncbi:peptidoglycan-binding protein [Pelagibius sp. Alg239-R121]|uniref:peptidoglycan-binding protein n=1 Tax=Pelagibius sp. Alg239-R121 TaxID=2993448 RepID=UPI0024A79F10|nr:peptidoglycan-binding protein [Pelagibius sp. Alg239-R121]
MATLKRGMRNDEVRRLQEKLKEAGFNPGGADGHFGKATDRAVRAFQASEGLLVDGIVGPRTLAVLSAEIEPDPPLAIATVTVEGVAKMILSTPRRNIETNLPPVLESLVSAELTDKPMVLTALATIRAESAGFLPIPEGKSRFNTSPGGHPFDLYDNRRDLGNQGPPDGGHFKGRGYIQLTGRDNYGRIGEKIGLGNGLVENPERANEPRIAAGILAAFLKVKERRIKEAIIRSDLRSARRLVNGGSHGLDRFSRAFRTGERVIV